MILLCRIWPYTWKCLKRKKEPHSTPRELANDELYLLEGQIELKADGKPQQLVKAGEERAQHPVFRVHTKGLSGRCLDTCRLLKIKREYTSKYQINHTSDDAPIKVEEISSDAISDTEQQLIHYVLNKFNSEEIELPSLPEIAIYINNMLGNDDISIKQLATTIHTDPIIAAGIIKVSNSAMYGTPTNIQSVQQAIARIGLEAVRAIVMSVVIRNLFKPRSTLIKKPWRVTTNTVFVPVPSVSDWQIFYPI